MYLKVTLLAVVFCLVQANATHLALNQADSELGKLKNIVEKAIDEAKNKVKGLLDSVKGKAQEIIEKTTEKIYNEINKFVDKVNALRQSAKEVGVDISECISENENPLEKLASKIVEDLLSCVTSKIKQAEDIVLNLFNSFKEISDLVLDFGNQIDLCRSSGKGITCIVKVTAKIAAAIAKLPLEIAKNSAQAVQLIEELQASIPVCAASKVLEAGVEGGKIVENIGNCVNEKLGS